MNKFDGTCSVCGHELFGELEQPTCAMCGAPCCENCGTSGGDTGELFCSDFCEKSAREEERVFEVTIKTSSDRGGVLVGNKDFCVLLKNGYGDGETRVVVTRDENYVNQPGYSYNTVVSGNEFGIYGDDCDDCKVAMPVLILSGEFQVFYNGDKMEVVFVKKVSKNE